MNGSIIKRGSGYSIVYRAPDPKTGKTKQVWKSGFTAYRAAERALKDIVRDLDDGTYTPPSTLTVREFVEQTWLRSLETSDLRASTVEMYRRSVTAYVLPHLGSLKLREVKAHRLTSWLEELKAAGKGNRTVEVAGITAHKLFKSALDRELINRNPCDNDAVRQARPKSKAKQPIVWSVAETRAFLDSQSDDRLFALWRLAAMTGLRRGELVALRWSDIDLDTGSLRVSHTFAVVGYKVIESEPKTDKSRRVIGIDPTTVNTLKTHRARQTEEMLAIGKQRSDDGYVFITNPQGEPYHPQRFTQMLGSKAKAAGLPVVKLHALRHGHTTHALESGVSMKIVQERLGHSSIAITSDIYSHVSPAVDQGAARQVAAFVDG